MTASTQNQALSALLFLYKEVLKRPLEWMDNIQRAKKPSRLPLVFTKEKAQSILRNLDGTKWLMASLLFGVLGSEFWVYGSGISGFTFQIYLVEPRTLNLEPKTRNPDPLHLMPIRKRLVHSHFIGVFQVRPNRHAHRDSCHSNPQRLEQPRKIIRRSFAFSVWVRSQYDLFDFALPKAFEQALDLQIIRSDSTYWRQRSVQDVIETLVVARLLNRHQIVRFFDYEQHAAVALRAGAVPARVYIGDIVAGRAEDNFVFDFGDGGDQSLRFFAIDFENVERQSLRGFVPDAWQSL